VFKGLTQRAQRILTVLAQEEARRAHSDQLLPEHIVIAILRDGEGVACKALSALNIDIVDFRGELEQDKQKRKSAIVFGDAHPSKRTRTLLEAAAEEARSLGHDYVGTEHLLVAASREKDSAIYRYLSTHSVDAELIKHAAFEFSGFGPNRGDGASSMHTHPSESSGLRASLSGDAEGALSEGVLSEGALSEEGPGFSPKDARLSKGGSTGRLQGKQSKTPLLDEFCRDLTSLAAEGKVDPVVGRRREIDRVIRILARRTKNNPVLVGEPGVGKTAVVEGLALLIAADSVPEMLIGKRLLSLDIASVVAGTKYRGEFEDRLKKLLREVVLSGNVILFIDELHTIIGAGGAEGTIDASNMLKPALARGELQCIGATTLAEYRKHLEKDAALERRFQAVLVEEPSTGETGEILRGIRSRYEDFHKVHFTDKAIEAAVLLSSRYISGRFLPDKAIDLLDEAGAKKRIERSARPPQIADIEEAIQRLTERKLALVSTQDYEGAAAARDEVRALRERLELAREDWDRSNREDKPEVGEADVQEVIAEVTGIPLSRLAESEGRRLLKIEEDLHRAIVGQDDSIRAVASAIRRSRAGVSSPRRPLGSFIFLGPTGVGKTLLAKRLAEYLFGSEEALVRIDMSDFMEKHNVSRLVGAPPGYIGYEEGGALTEKIRRNPYRVVLFDEIEKAHHDVFNLLLQVLEEGELKDNLGHTVSFRNTVIIMTSNAGAREISRDAKLGFSVSTGIMSVKEIKDSALAELKRLFNPEFINRVDDLVVFHALDREQVARILEIQIGELQARLAEKEYQLKVTDPAKDLLIRGGYDPKYGARPMRRMIQRSVEDPLAALLLEKPCAPGTQFIVDAQGEDLTVKARQLHPKSPRKRPGSKRRHDGETLGSGVGAPAVDSDAASANSIETVGSRSTYTKGISS